MVSVRGTIPASSKSILNTRAKLGEKNPDSARTFPERQREMFGRVRAASSSVESLEMERPPSKILKDHSLSIYEVTLMKLRQGSRLSPIISPPVDEAMEMESFCGIAAVPGSLTESMTTETGSCTIVHGSSQRLVASVDEAAMTADADCSSGGSRSVDACHFVDDRSRRPSRDASITYLFSKYKTSHPAVPSPSSDEEAMETAG